MSTQQIVAPAEPGHGRAAGPRHDARQAVMLSIGGETFAFDAEIVREIIDPIPVTRVAGARSFLPGVVNVRGNVVPLADIRERFGMPHQPDTPDTRFVVIEIEIEGDPVVLAVIADKVHEVTEISGAGAQTTPRIGTRWRPDYIQFITRWNDQFVIVPDLKNVLQ